MFVWLKNCHQCRKLSIHTDGITRIKLFLNNLWTYANSLDRIDQKWYITNCGSNQAVWLYKAMCPYWLNSDFILKVSLPSDSASDIIHMLKFRVACVLSVRRYRRKLVSDIDQFVYGETPSKSKIFQNWRFLRILHGIWLDGVFFLPIILIHTRIISVLKL